MTRIPGIPRVFQKSYRYIYKLYRHSAAFTTSEKCVGAPGTPGIYQRSYKNIYNLGTHSGASLTSEKCLGHLRHSKNPSEVIQKYS